MIRENPDTRYIKPYNDSGCYNTIGICTNGTTGCVFGQILIKLGHSPRENSSIRNELQCLGFQDRLEINWAQDIQGYQDSNMTWGESLAKANLKYPEIKEKYGEE